MAKRVTLKRAWLVSVLAYSLIRTLIIWKIFQKYGVNQYVYLVIDLICAFFFAKYSTKVVLEANQTHYKNLLKNLFLTLIFNFIPDVEIKRIWNEIDELNLFLKQPKETGSARDVENNYKKKNKACVLWRPRKV